MGVPDFALAVLIAISAFATAFTFGATAPAGSSRPRPVTVVAAAVTFLSVVAYSVVAGGTGGAGRLLGVIVLLIALAAGWLTFQLTARRRH